MASARHYSTSMTLKENKVHKGLIGKSDLFYITSIYSRGTAMKETCSVSIRIYLCTLDILLSTKSLL